MPVAQSWNQAGGDDVVLHDGKFYSLQRVINAVVLLFASRIVKVRETRLTGMFSHILIGLSLLLLPHPLAYIPTAVLNGLFLYMAITSLNGNQMFERITLFFTEQVSLALSSAAILTHVIVCSFVCCFWGRDRLLTRRITTSDASPSARSTSSPGAKCSSWASCVSSASLPTPT